MDQATLAHQEIPRDERKRRQDANLVRRLYLRAYRHHQEGAQAGGLALHDITDSVDLRFRQKPSVTSLAA